MVLHSTEKRIERGAMHEHSDALDGDGKDADGVPWYCCTHTHRYCAMYDHIEAKMNELDPQLYKTLCEQPDAEGFTPLTLAAARGSLKMFNHLLSKLMVPI